MSRHESRSEQETIAVAAGLAPALKRGDIVCLHGDLGMGKSVFARALIRTLSGQPDLDVPSPTFTLAQTYDTLSGPVWHFDLYRLKNPDDIFELGWDEACAEGIVIVEWPERLGSNSPQSSINVFITGAGSDRLLIIEPAK